ncbi:MAG TPA: DUF4127 family protein [Virgibacillus sp.]|nr:DUF4127 family protein [Virgibacillus sp.]
MTKIVYLPLDERPCNLVYPQMLANMTDIEFISPEKSMLGNKKNPAEFKTIEEWLLKTTLTSEYLIVSIDMLVYGGIVPSRIHNLSFAECEKRLNVLKQIQKNNPDIKIYAFDLIMRVPAYNNSDEEPDYYSQYGYDIFLYGFLMDKKKRGTLTNDEENQLNKLKEEIPSNVSEDFIGRRKVNAYVNELAIEFVDQHIIEDLIIPLDDNSEYGFSAEEQRQLLFKVEDLNLIDRIFIYPGADEVGCVLFSRVFCRVKQYTGKVYTRFSSTLGPFVKPVLEDRSLGESIKSQVTAANAIITSNDDDADVILMVNSPASGQSDMAGPVPYNERHHSYFSEINYIEFMESIRHFVSKETLVALADVSTINGSDHTLMKLLAKNDLIDKLGAYAGWNTCGNTLGTVIAFSIIRSYERTRSDDSKQDDLFFYYRIIEDWGYQSLIRQEVTQSYLEELGGNYFDISMVESEVKRLVHDKLTHFINSYLHHCDHKIEIANVGFPWKRMFEVEFDLVVND